MPRQFHSSRLKNVLLSLYCYLVARFSDNTWTHDFCLGLLSEEISYWHLVELFWMSSCSLFVHGKRLVLVLLGSGSASLDSWSQTFRDGVVVHEHFDPRKYDTTASSRNDGNHIVGDATPKP
jgi:hypothetical protein